MNVSTEQFWEYMCDPRFIRVDLYTGKIMGKEIRAVIPPEESTGFLDSKICETINLVSDFMR